MVNIFVLGISLDFLPAKFYFFDTLSFNNVVHEVKCECFMKSQDEAFLLSKADCSTGRANC